MSNTSRIFTWNQPIELDHSKSGEHQWSFMFVIMKGHFSDVNYTGLSCWTERMHEQGNSVLNLQSSEAIFKKYPSKACLQQQDDWEGSAKGNLVY